LNAPIATNNLDDKIAEERALLLRATRDVIDGQVRLGRQYELLNEMRIKRLDTRHAERLIEVLSATLEQWERHRVMIGERLAYLEAQRH
jgi:hypothetical protein